MTARPSAEERGTDHFILLACITLGVVEVPDSILFVGLAKFSTTASLDANVLHFDAPPRPRPIHIDPLCTRKAAS